MRFSAALAISVLTVSSPAFAQQQQRAALLDQFVRLDADGDGSVSRAEAERGRTLQFARLDTDRNGSISEAERSGGGRGGQALARADTDGDGAISRAEAMAAPYRLFDRLDADSNDTVSAEEIASARAQMGGG